MSPHAFLDWPVAGSDAVQEEVQQVGAAGLNVKVYVEVFVEEYAHAMWTFVVFWSDLVAQLDVGGMSLTKHCPVVVS